MTATPAVSAIVPVFNGERFLAECLEAILAQDPPPLEVIVVDDGSTDGSAAVAEALGSAHPSVRVLRRPHEGLHPTRNAGVEAAIGHLIAWSDSDDVWKPGKLAAQLAYLEAHPACDIVLARMEVTFEEGTEWPRWLRPDPVYGDLDGIAMTSGLYRRDVFRRVGGFRAQTGGDFELLIRARTAGCEIAVLDMVDHMRRIHDQNMITASDDPEVGGRAFLPAVREHLRKQRAR